MLFWGQRTNGKQGSVATCYFCSPKGPQKRLLGASPNPALRDILSQSKLSASPSLPLLFLILAPVRHAQQIVNVGLDHHGLPHFLLGDPVLGVQGLFSAASLRRFSLIGPSWAVWPRPVDRSK